MVTRQTISGRVDRSVEVYIQNLADEVDRWQHDYHRLYAQVQSNKPLSLDQIRAALEATGLTPLNITQLLGVSSLSSTARFGPHSDRLSLSLAALPSGTMFLETDRHAVYVLNQSKNWILIIAWGTGSTGLRPVDLGAGDVDFRFFDTSLGVVFRWTGSAWLHSMGIRRDTHANRPLVNIETGFYYMESDRGDQVYRWNGGAWQFCKGWGGPMTVTLSPNTKPVGFGSNDAGFLVWASDFDRVYRWIGSAWADGYAAPPRYHIGLFQQSPVPGGGWFLCDGSTVTQSKEDGTTASFVTPDLTSSPQFPRMNSTAGGAGGASPFNTGVPSATTTVDNSGGGSTVAVGSATHTHAVSQLPPYYDLVPWIRL